MKSQLIFIVGLFIVTFCTGQTQDREYYQLTKNGKKYPKPVEYIRFDKNCEKISIENSSDIIFNIKGETFKYKSSEFRMDTISSDQFEKLHFSNIDQLERAEYAEHIRATSQEKIKMPPPPNHYNLKIYIIETLCDKRALKYEVEWVYSIQ